MMKGPKGMFRPWIPPSTRVSVRFDAREVWEGRGEAKKGLGNNAKMSSRVGGRIAATRLERADQIGAEVLLDGAMVVHSTLKTLEDVPRM
jgi:hypothetical protein